MSEAFRGEFSQKVDPKARVSIPAAFRRAIEAGDPGAADSRSKFIIIYGGGSTRKYLECRTINGMAQLEARIALMPSGSERRRYVEHNMITPSLVAVIDVDGRIVMPPKAREKIGLGGTTLKDGSELIFAGSLDKFHIWRHDTYEADQGHLAEPGPEILSAGADMLSIVPDFPGG